MSDSLRDQLLKAGLVSRTQVAEAERRQNRDRHQQAKSGAQPGADDEKKRRTAAAAQAAKAARDRELDEKRREKIEARARAAEIRQLVEQHALPRPEGDEYYNFIAGKRIRRVAVNTELLGKLERAVIDFGTGSGAPEAVDEDDPYRDFVVPDDLRW